MSHGGPPTGRAEARRRLATAGVPGPLDGPATWVFPTGERYALLPSTLAGERSFEARGFPGPAGADDDGLRVSDLERGFVRRAVPLGPRALLVDEGERIPLRIWRLGERGRVWARW